MTDHLGSFCLVLHAHLPFVLHHGQFPHGEHWLYEAAAETYLPILDLIGEVALHQSHPGLTIGLTPVLLEQLAHPTFKQRFPHYLEDRIAWAKRDEAAFMRDGQLHMAHLAQRWADWYGRWAKKFNDMGRDIPKAFAERAKEGHIEILTSNATHGYMPLLLEDACVRAQVRAGIASSERILGIKPTGMWLPECAYRPAGPWYPPVVYGDRRDRWGVDGTVAAEGITHFFVEGRMLDAEYCNPLLPLGVLGPFGEQNCYAFGRHSQVCEKVWSGSIGYPAAGEYLEFHKKHNGTEKAPGLRYWKVTRSQSDLGEKDLYYPDDVPGVMHGHVQHFCHSVRDALRQYQRHSQSPAVVTVSFDAELFGHWWFEGPRFLRDVILELNNDPSVDVVTTSEYLERHQPQHRIHMREGSWGDGGDHRVWLNDKTYWMWEMDYRAEAKFGRLTYHSSWQTNAEIRRILELAGRELLLMQASDWPFVIYTQGAVDYGIQRFCEHATRFQHMCNAAEKLIAGAPLDEFDKLHIREVEMHDSVFEHVDLSWWSA